VVMLLLLQSKKDRLDAKSCIINRARLMEANFCWILSQLPCSFTLKVLNNL
jgi:hypothetical protein